MSNAQQHTPPPQDHDLPRGANPSGSKTPLYVLAALYAFWLVFLLANAISQAR
jgi:hypothetical protein